MMDAIALVPQKQALSVVEEVLMDQTGAMRSVVMVKTTTTGLVMMVILSVGMVAAHIAKKSKVSPA